VECGSVELGWIGDQARWCGDFGCEVSGGPGVESVNIAINRLIKFASSSG